MEVDDVAFGMHLVLKRLVMANKENAVTLQMTKNVTSAFGPLPNERRSEF